MKILIEPIINDEAHGQAIQAKKFVLGLKITNKDNAPSTQITIGQINYKSAQGQDIVSDCENKSFVVNPINPNESQNIEVGTYGFPGYGLVTIKAKVIGAPENLILLQKDAYSGIASPTQNGNNWVDFIYVESVTENQQRRANTIMIVLTNVIIFLTTLQVFKLFQAEIITLISYITASEIGRVTILTQVLAVVAGIIASITITKITGLSNKNK